jgi:predicted TIM-barrel fold metal-dependent hydrolase
MLFGASVHPYRKDALAELERCIANGAVLLKWLPIVQDFDPSDRRCIPIYEAMAHHGLPLLSHTGGERSLPNLNKDMADPMLLMSAIERGVTGIAANCGTRSRGWFQSALFRCVCRRPRHWGFWSRRPCVSSGFHWPTSAG